MRVTVSGSDLSGWDISLRESVFENCAVLQFSLASMVPVTKVEFDSHGDLLPFTVVQVETKGDRVFEYTAYPSGYVNFLNSVTRPVNLRGSLKDLLLSLAPCEYRLYHATPIQDWVLPSLRGGSLMKEIYSSAVGVNGGCPTVHFSPDGVLVFVDLLTESSQDAKFMFDGSVQSTRNALTWINQSSGRVVYRIFGNETYSKEETVFLRDAGVVNAYKYLVDDNFLANEVSKHQALFWRRYYSNNVISVTSVINAGIIPGFRGTFLSQKQDYVCVSVAMVGGQDMVEVTAEFVPVVLFGQGVI